MKKIFLITLLISITFSCEDFDGWNVDSKNPSTVPGSYLFTSAEKAMFDQMTSTSVNSNIFKMFAQNWTETQYTDEANYDIRGRDIGGNFSSNIYRNVLNDLQEASKIISADEFLDATTKANSLAMIEIFSIYTWHVMVDTFGDIPYSQALVGVENLLPAYDDDAAIYTALFSRLDIALAMLKPGGSVGAADLIYNGNIDQWIKFGNSLKLKMAVRTADFDQARSTKLAGEAMSNIFTSSSDNASFPYEANPPNNNPIWGSLVQSGRNDFVLASTFIDLIAPLNDPRKLIFMDENLQEDLGEVSEIKDPVAPEILTEIVFTEDFEESPVVGDKVYNQDLEFIGYVAVTGTNSIKIKDIVTSPKIEDGLSFSIYVGATYGAGSSYVDYTHAGELWHTPDFEAVIMSYSEVNFLMAEAVERGLITGNAEMYYNEAITASINYWGNLSGETFDASAYLAQAEVAYDAANWKKSIGIQKYLSLYGRGFEAWSSWRLLDFPNTMQKPDVSQEPVPRRYLYGNSDTDINGDNYDAASAAMGGDLKTSRVFWDIKGQGN